MTMRAKLDRKDLSNFIRGFVRDDPRQGEFDWDYFISVRHKDKLVEAASRICSFIGIECPPDRDDRWCSLEGYKRLLALADILEVSRDF